MIIFQLVMVIYRESTAMRLRKDVLMLVLATAISRILIVIRSDMET